MHAEAQHAPAALSSAMLLLSCRLRSFLRAVSTACVLAVASTAFAITTGSAGGGQAFDSSQPTMALTWMIAYQGMIPDADASGADRAAMVGEIRLFAFGSNQELSGWIPCNGQTLSKDIFPALFSIIGTTFGGDGVTTFKAPDLRNRVPMGKGQGSGLTARSLGETGGAETTTLSVANLPVHQHTVNGVFTTTEGQSSPVSNLQPFLVLNFCVEAKTSFEAMGNIRIFAFDFTPGGFVPCDGTSLTISTNASLFSRMGFVFGGNASSTFAVPDLRGRIPVITGNDGVRSYPLGLASGTESFTLTSAQLPAHVHSLSLGSTSLAGMSQPLATMQPYLALRATIMTEGLWLYSDEEPTVGEIRLWATDTSTLADQGWLNCSGQLQGIGAYELLYTLIGTTYGGDGETSFAVPNLIGRSLSQMGTRSLGATWGSETVTLATSHMAAHTHAIANTKPVLRLSAAQSLTFSEDGSGQDIASSLDVVDTDFGQTLTWSASVAPTRGTLSPATRTALAVGTNTPIVPSAITYTPNANQNGSDTFTIQVSDAEDTDTLVFNVTITAVNDEPGAISDVNAATDTVAENATNGATVGITAQATDVDGDTLTYSLTDDAGERFTINASTGVVTVADASLLNYEAATSHSITMQVTDGTTPKTKTFSIAVTNVAPSSPTDANAAANEIAEGSANGTAVGITASAADPHGGTVTYSLSDDAGGRFTIGSSTGIVTVANTSLISRAGATSHTITVRAADAADAASTQTFTINVLAPLNTAPVAGLGTALLLEAANYEGVTVPHATSFNVGAGSFTIEAWFKRTATGEHLVAGKIDNDSGTGWTLDFSNNQLVFRTLEISDTVVSGTVRDPIKITDSNWHHVAAVRDSSANTLRLYVDGMLRNSTAIATVANVNNESPLGIGDMPGYGIPFEGSMDDVRFWNVARTASQIGEYMHAPLTGAESGLIGYWDFEDGTGTVVGDRSGHGHHGTLVNGDGDEWTSGNVAHVVYIPEETTASFRLGGGDDDDGVGIATAVITALPQHGTLTQADGTAISVAGVSLTDLTGNPRRVIYTPQTTHRGADSLTYKVNDGSADSANTVTITLTTYEVNDAPVATDDVLSDVAARSSARTISFATLLANDSTGAEEESAQTLTITAVSNPTGGTVEISGHDLIFTPTSGFTGTASFDYTVRDDGRTNGANDYKTTTGTVSFDITDTTAPDTTIDSTPASVSASSSATFQFSGDDHGGVGVAAFHIQLDGGGFISAVSPVTLNGLSEGPHTFQVRATDFAGNVDATPASYTWTIDITAPAAPIVITPANGSTTNDSTPTYTGTAESSSTVILVVDGSAVGTTTASGDGSWFFTPVVALAVGPHTAKAMAADAAGNISSDSATNTFTVDTTAPSAPVVTAPADGTNTTNLQPVISGVAESNSTVTVIVDGVPIGTTSANASGNWSLTSGSLALGSHTVRATATDAAGNTSPSSNTNSFTVTQPALSISDVSQSEGQSGTTTFTFTVSLSLPAPAGGVTFDIGTADGTATSESDYTTNSLTGQTIAAGNQTYTFNVSVAGDHVPESAETFFVNVTNVTGASVGDAQATGTITNDDTVDLSVTLSDSPDPVVAGTNLTYTISVTNGGSGTASSAALSFTLPTGTTFEALVIPGGWNATVPAVGATGTISASVASLNAGASHSLTVVVGVDVSTVADSITATATVSGADADINAANNTASTTTAIGRLADLSIAIATPAGPAAAGANAAFVATVTNAGPNTATNVVVFVRLSGRASLAAATPSQGTGSVTGNDVLFSAGTIPSGGSATFTLTAAMAPDASPGAGVTAWGVVNSGSLDSNSDDNSVTFESIVGPALNAGLATPLGNVTSGVRVSENIYPAGDADVYSFSGHAGDRVFIATATTASSDETNASRDTLIRVVGSDGVTVLEVDDDDGGLSSTSSSIAGLTLPSDGTYFIVVECLRPEAIIFPYELYVRSQSGTPMAETDASATGQSLTAEGWVAGSLADTSQTDLYSIHLHGGQTVFVSLDLDPERDGTGWDGYLAIAKDTAPTPPFDSYINGSDLVSDTPPSSEAMVFTAKSSSIYYFEVGSVTAAGNYQLSVTVLPGAMDHAVATYQGSASPIIVPDGGQAVSTLTIENSRRIGSARVAIDLSDDLAGDLRNLDVHLTSPHGSTVGLVRHGDGFFFGAIDVILDDAAAYAISFEPDAANIPPEMSNLFGVTLKPDRHSRLSWFSGQDAKGDWKLTIRDRDQDGDEFTLNGWSLIIAEDAPLSTGDVRVPHLEADFNTTDGGFTHSGTNDEWAHGIPVGSVIDSAHSGTQAWVTDLAGNYATTSSQTLTSPAIDLTNVGASAPVHLSWAMKYQLADASTTTAYVEVEEVGGAGSSRIVWRWLGPTMRDEGVGSLGLTIEKSAGWGVHQAVISEFAGKTIRLNFHLSTDNAVALEGWAIDDVSVVSYRDAASNANLSSLALSSGTLSPVFASGTTSYTATVANSVTSVTVTAATADANATMTVNGSATASGAASGSINLNVGENVITTTVTAEDGATTKSYTATITRQPNSNADLSNLVLSTGTLTPAFASGTTSYTANVAHASTSVTITPTLAEATATVKVNGVAVASGNATAAIALNVGANTITVTTTAQDGTTTKTYTIVVTRAASSNADLSALAVSAGTLSPAFASNTTSYAAGVTHATTSITVTPTPADSTATVKVNGTNVTSGNASGAIALNVGANTASVLVTAQDGTTKTYTINVTRAPGSNSALASLTLSAGTLSPTFAPGTAAYTASVPYSTASVAATATVAQSGATLTVNGQATASGTPSAPIDLAPGANTIDVVVTAQDGIATTTYQIQIARALGYHSADTDQNWRLSLLELTRVIELYNTRDGTTRTGAYHTDATTEDGFAAGTGTIASHHSADTNQDGRLSLLELTRVIELYNTREGTTRTGAYHRTESETEDGFAPGASVKS